MTYKIVSYLSTAISLEFAALAHLLLCQSTNAIQMKLQRSSHINGRQHNPMEFCTMYGKLESLCTRFFPCITILHRKGLFTFSMSF